MKYPCNDSVAHGIVPKFMYHAIYCLSKDYNIYLKKRL